MMQQAAISLGIEVHLLAEGPDVSAAQVVPLLVGSAINVVVAVIAGIALAAAGLAGRSVRLMGSSTS